ncbi:NUDIX domain-containing protein [Xanthobacter oligotrophicus]|uniref:NUDIX domain-containing protein n=1 Tax=Xanthobacter oligotrophicus TaxID=2607286 RepID=A0ABW7A3Q1_9HYPH
MSPPPVWPALPVATGGPSGRRVQYAALPYRVRRDGEVQIRLITSRETRRWVIPKGWPMKGLSPPKAAAREAYEEAGLVGVISREPLGMYTYEKRLGTRSVLCDVLVFPLKVKRLLEKWPERFQRYGFWFSIDSAAAAVQEEDLSELIRSFGEIMARRWEAERLEAQQKTKAKAPKDKPASAVRGDEVPVEERESKANPTKDNPTKAKGTKAKPDKARSQKAAQVAADADSDTAVEPQSAGKARTDKARTDKARADKGKTEKAKPDKIKAEKALPAKGVKAKSEKAAKAKARTAGDETAAIGSASEPAAATKKAAKGKGGKAARKGAQVSLLAAPDVPPPVVAKVGRDVAPVAAAKAHGRPIRKAAVAKRAETVTKPGWMPEKKAPSAKKVTSPKKASTVKKGTAVRKAAPAMVPAKAPAKVPAKLSAKPLAGEAATGVSRSVPKGASADKRKAKTPAPPEKPGS